MKLAYQVALRLLHQSENAEHSTAREEKKFWNTMWKLLIPPKVRNFTWWACFNILPTSTNTNLCRRRIPVDSTCTICQQHEETVAHVFWECPLASNVWGMVKGYLQKCNSETLNFYILARQMEEKLPKKDLELWAMVSWSIWNARNCFLFEKKQSMPSDILQGATNLLQEYQRLCRTSTSTWQCGNTFWGIGSLTRYEKRP